ncbi:MAG: Ldh family oxidoreductase, partial [Acidimicrobiia bacterium]|nr:Ldh family oxidoreductase [Acidimicrobiia bacterium]
AWVGTRHSNHAGAAGVYPALALRNGLGAVYMAVAAGNTMPPWGGLERLLGTNPLAVAIPAGDEIPFQLDIATTVSSHGTIRVMALAGERLPVGWVVDADGEPITDPDQADEGFLVPIGGHKGSGLNIMIGLIAGVMNGAAFGRDVVGHSHPAETPSNTGQTMIAFRPDLFSPLAEFRSEMDQRLRELRSSGKNGTAVRLSGENAAQLEAEQRNLGIPVPEPLLADLRVFAADLKLKDRLDG